MVAELELNSVIPSPDMIEEEDEKKQSSSRLTPLRTPSHVKVNSKREIREARHFSKNGK